MAPLVRDDEFVVSPSIDFLPTRFEVNFSYLDAQGDRTDVTQPIALRYQENFAELSETNDPFLRYWSRIGELR